MKACVKTSIRRLRLRTLLTLSTLLLAGGSISEADAQTVGVRGRATWATGEHLVPVAGVEAHLRPGRLPLVISAGYQRGSETEPCVFCVGMVPVGHDCAPQTAQVQTEMYSLMLGYPERTEGQVWHRWANPQVGLAAISSAWESHVSEAMLTHNALALAVGLDLGLSRRVRPTLPLRVAAGVHGWLALGMTGACMDCFVASYEGGFAATGLSLGLEYEFR